MNDWEKIRESGSSVVWRNKKKNRRVVAAKGYKTWQVWKEKDEGKVGSDKSYLRNGWIAAQLNKTEAIAKAREYIRKN